MNGSRLCALALLLPSLASAHRVRTVNASGQAVIVGPQTVARSQAIDLSLRHAVEEVVLQLGGPREGEDQGFDRGLYDRARIFVPRMAVLAENVDGNVLTVEISAEVDGDAIAATLGPHRAVHPIAAAPATGNAIGGKRVLVLATEQLGPHQVFGWTDVAFGPSGFSTKTTAMRVVNEMGGMEATLGGEFGNAGFDVIDPHVLHGRLAARPAFEVLDLSTGDARSIAQKSDADLVIVAKGVAQIAGTLGEMSSGQANVVARLIRVRDGKVLATATEHAAQVHIDPATARIQALDEATRMAATSLVRKINFN